STFAGNIGSVRTLHHVTGTDNLSVRARCKLTVRSGAPYKTAIGALHCIIRTDDTFLIRARCKLTIRSRVTHSTAVGAHLRVVCADNLSVRARCKLTIRTGTPDAAAIRTDFRL